MNDDCYILIAAEGDLDCAVISKLCSFSARRYIIDRQINAHGFGQLKAGMAKFHAASHAIPHVLLTDLDRYNCPPALINDWSVNKNLPGLLFNIAVREVEAWLLADRDGIAAFLHIPPNKVTQYPENEPDPKQTLINLARRSKKKALCRRDCPCGGIFSIHRPPL